MTQALFTGISQAANNGPSGAWDSVNYLAPAGQFAGAPGGGFQASALFMPTYPSADQQVWGNFDAAGLKGWQIGNNNTNIVAQYYDVGGLVQGLTFQPSVFMRRWFYVTLGYVDGGGPNTALLALWVNGTLVASTPALPVIAPAVGQACVGGADAAFALPFAGLVAGVAYSANNTGVDPFASAIDVARTGQIARPDTSSGGAPTQPANAWQVPFYNMDASPLWLPATGSVNLTRNGQGTMRAFNAPANTWY